MARTWGDKNNDLQIKQREAAAYKAGREAGVNAAMMIAAHPSDPYKADKYEREYLDGLYKNLQIKKEAGKDPVDVFKDGIQGEFDLSKGPVLPDFKPMGKVITGIRDGVLPMKDTKIKRNLQIGPQTKVNYGKPTKLDNYFKEKGYPTRDDPDWLRLQIMRGAPKAQAPANNIRRLRDSGHKTDYTGSFRLGDDGKLIPQLGITKADANNIRRLRDSGHQLVIDDDNPNRLKIIKQFQPPRA